MEFSDYLWIKFFALVGLAFLVNLIYSAFTGKTLGQEPNDTPTAPPRDSLKG